MIALSHFPSLSPSDLEFVATRAAGLGWLRSKLGASGLLGRAESAASERLVLAARDGLACGWSGAGDQGEDYEGEAREWYLAALRAGESAAPEARS